MKCQICHEEQAEWAWMPFGPGETANEYALLGSHARGFPIIKVGSSCKNAFQTGDFPVAFEYKGHHFVGKDHEVKEVHVSLWVGESCHVEDFGNHPARALMRDSATRGIDVAALVFEDNADLLHALCIAPELLEACQELDALRGKIEQWSEWSHVYPEDRHAVLMALAKVHVAMEKE